MSNKAFGIQGLKAGRKNKYLVENNLNLNVAVSNKSFQTNNSERNLLLKDIPQVS